MLPLLSSVFGGGLTALFGTIVSKVAEYKSKQLDLQLEAQQAAHAVELAKVNAGAAADAAAAAARVEEAKADAAAFVASQGSEPQKFSDRVQPTPGQAWLLVALDVFRGMVRPALTLYLCAITTAVYLQTRRLIGPGAAPVTPDQAVELLHLVTHTVLYLTTTCVLWWFGTRSKSAAPTS